MANPILTIPLEVLDNVAFHLACSSTENRGPPSPLIPLLLTCKHIHTQLAPANCPALYARIFRSKFAHSAVRRRAFNPTSRQYLDQLIHFCTYLQIIRSGDLWTLDIDNVLFAAYIMLLEDDGGKNRAQLEWAGTRTFVERFIRTRLYDGRWEGHQGGWPVESPQAACALWVYWMLTTRGTFVFNAVYLPLAFAA